MYIPYSTKIQIKPIFIHNPLLLKPTLTNKGEVIEIGENAKGVEKGQTVIYNPDANCIYGEHFFIDQEYITAIL
jgi:NADPH:quinone reductase-like Zn-dependent oxidoreductase